ncbi:MAG: hypothetical protein ABIU54_13160 [Candidatus Eisenbacteria bacterium]
MTLRRSLALALIGMLCLLLVGCFNPFSPLVSTDRGVSSPAPVPNSPSNVIRLFEWCYNNRAIDEYRELFTDDYVFKFAVGDSAGQNRDRPVDREEELTTATNLFVGGSDRPPASRIVLDFDKNLFALPDTRPGKNGKWHKAIRTTVNLKVEIADGSTLEVTGFALFYLVRGDSAAIPTDLPGATNDSTRWWISGWDDETIPPSGMPQSRPVPVMRSASSTDLTPIAASWGMVKALFGPIRR